MRGEYQRVTVVVGVGLELPPRARRIPAGKKTLRRCAGTTSACAENTCSICASLLRLWNYLRVRGEYAWACSVFCIAWELPPRARRILTHSCSPRQSLGTTSACAENTWSSPSESAYSRNYLRVRGEYRQKHSRRFGVLELPPRARRIRVSPLSPNQDHGTTSACAENTVMRAPTNHPRGELPPRARRIRLHRAPIQRCEGTTSACAENTHTPHGRQTVSWNYLRVRGEYSARLRTTRPIAELPPRARRILGGMAHAIDKFGTTSACAENTPPRHLPIS